MIDTSFKDALLVAASRIAKIVVGFGTTWLLVEWKVDLPPILQAGFEQILAAAFAGSILGTAAHFGVALRANPNDTVSPTESKIGRQKKKARKETRKIETRLKKAGVANREAEVQVSHDDLPPPPPFFRPTEGP